MTNIQLLLSIGVPSFLVVLSWLSNNSRFERNEKRLDEVSRRLDELAAATNKRFDDLLVSTHRDALEILRSMTALHERVAVVEAKQNG